MTFELACRVHLVLITTAPYCTDHLLQVFILNGASYDQRFLDATRTSSLSRADSSNPDSVAALNKDLDDCALLSNNKGKPLLASLAGGKTTDDGRLLIQAVVSDVKLERLVRCLSRGRAPLHILLLFASANEVGRQGSCWGTNDVSHFIGMVPLLLPVHSLSGQVE